jgi:MFS family permease
MAFFHNRSVNLINLHYIVGSVAMGGGGAFYSVYLLKAGLSLPHVILALAGIFGVRFAIRMMVLPLGIRIGLRRLLILGTLLMAASFPFLIFVQGIGIGLGALILSTAVADAFYWPSYHAYFAALGDEEHRGQQIGLRESVVAALGIASPLAAGWLLVTFGPVAAFGATAVIQALAAVPLLWTPDVAVARSAPGAFQAALSGVLLFIADGWSTAGYFIVWQIALFMTLGQNYLAYGGALAVAALVGAAAGLFLGRLIDGGNGKRAVWIAIGVSAFVIGLRAVSLRSPALAIVANALGAFVTCLYIPTLMTAVYNNAKRSSCTLRYHIASEGGWDAGIAAGLLAAAAIIGAGLPVPYAIGTALIGTATVFVLLMRYYSAHAAERVDAALIQAEEAKI